MSAHVCRDRVDVPCCASTTVRNRLRVCQLERGHDGEHWDCPDDGEFIYHGAARWTAPRADSGGEGA